MRVWWWIGLVVLVTAGCVPKQRYLALEAQLAADQAAHEDLLGGGSRRIGTLESEVASRDRSVAVLEAEKANLEAEKATLDAQLDEVTREKAGLLSDRAQLAGSVEETRQALRDMMARKAASDARVAQYRDLVRRFRSLIDAGRVSVEIVDGRMVVGLATDVLFASGRAELSPEGEAAVREVAAVFVEVPGQRYQVEGHTDTVPIRTAQFPSNWELASARAITVVRALVAAGLTPERVSGASYGEHRPIGDNGTAEGRGRNRRIEITVVPDLSLLPGHDELNEIAD